MTAQLIATPLGKVRLRRRAARVCAIDACRASLERLPALYLGVARRRNNGPRRPLVDRRTDLVIEGFPRSGNTYLLSWTSLASPELRIASHSHTGAHLRVAVRMGIPTVVLLRPPEEAISSEILRAVSEGMAVSPSVLLRRYERFYRAAIKQAGDVTISPFEMTVEAPQKVLTAVAECSSLSLSATQPRPEAVAQEIERLNRIHSPTPNEMTVARPSVQRTAATDQIREVLRTRYSAKLAELRGLHDHLAAHPAAVR